VLDEQITVGTFAGLLLILVGSWVATGGRIPRRRRMGRRRGCSGHGVVVDRVNVSDLL